MAEVAGASWRTGLVFGKFMPVHNGHLALIRYAAARCDRLLVLLCSQPWEAIDGSLRLQWVAQALADELGDTNGIEVHHCTDELPYSGLPSPEISGVPDRSLASSPADDTLTRCVTLSCRSRTKMSM